MPASASTARRLGAGRGGHTSSSATRSARLARVRDAGELDDELPSQSMSHGWLLGRLLPQSLLRGPALDDDSTEEEEVFLNKSARETAAGVSSWFGSTFSRWPERRVEAVLSLGNRKSGQLHIEFIFEMIHLSLVEEPSTRRADRGSPRHSGMAAKQGDAGAQMEQVVVASLRFANLHLFHSAESSGASHSHLSIEHFEAFGLGSATPLLFPTAPLFALSPRTVLRISLALWPTRHSQSTPGLAQSTTHYSISIAPIMVRAALAEWDGALTFWDLPPTLQVAAANRADAAIVPIQRGTALAEDCLNAGGGGAERKVAAVASDAGALGLLTQITLHVEAQGLFVEGPRLVDTSAGSGATGHTPDEWWLEASVGSLRFTSHPVTEDELSILTDRNPPAAQPPPPAAVNSWPGGLAEDGPHSSSQAPNTHIGARINFHVRTASVVLCRSSTPDERDDLLSPTSLDGLARVAFAVCDDGQNVLEVALHMPSLGLHLRAPQIPMLTALMALGSTVVVGDGEGLPHEARTSTASAAHDVAEQPAAPAAASSVPPSPPAATVPLDITFRLSCDAFGVAVGGASSLAALQADGLSVGGEYTEGGKVRRMALQVHGLGVALSTSSGTSLCRACLQRSTLSMELLLPRVTPIASGDVTLADDGSAPPSPFDDPSGEDTGCSMRCESARANGDAATGTTAAMTTSALSMSVSQAWFDVGDPGDIPSAEALRIEVHPQVCKPALRYGRDPPFPHVSSDMVSLPRPLAHRSATAQRLLPSASTSPPPVSR